MFDEEKIWLQSALQHHITVETDLIRSTANNKLYVYL